MGGKDYGADALAPGWRRKTLTPTVEGRAGLVVEDPDSGFCGELVSWDKAAMTLEDRFGAKRLFPWSTVFLLDGRATKLTRPVVASPVSTGLTRSGSVAVQRHEARVARAGRILVEGRHDAELIEQVWGEDLRIEGVVVELLDGADHLPEVIEEFGPGRDARLGVLLDHLVAGSKESRIVERIAARHRPHVLVVGHPYVDIWAAVKPERLGLTAWPEIPRQLDWKTGMAAVLGEPDSASAWRRIRGRVRDWRDLDHELIRPVEQIIDFVTEPAG